MEGLNTQRSTMVTTDAAWDKDPATLFQRYGSGMIIPQVKTIPARSCKCIEFVKLGFLKSHKRTGDISRLVLPINDEKKCLEPNYIEIKRSIR